MSLYVQLALLLAGTCVFLALVTFATARDANAAGNIVDGKRALKDDDGDLGDNP